MNSTQSAAPAIPVNLRTEYLENPLGIDVRRPSFGWQLAASTRGIMQRAYQVQAAAAVTLAAAESGDLDPDSGLLWDSGKVLTPNAIAIPYEGPELPSRQRCWWRVRIWDQADRPSPWSEAAWFEMGLLTVSDWCAEWIEVPWEEDPQAFKPCPYFRTGFTLDQPIVSARLYITAHGLYEAWLNGERVGDQVFTPGFTAYDKRLQYQVYDVTAQLRQGANALGAILGDGWYRGKVYVTSSRNVYGTRLGLLALLRIETAGGEVVVATGPAWKAATGPILKSDMKDGETYDARLELGEWTNAGYDDSRWQRVRVAARPKYNLVASLGVPVRRKETFRPQVLKTPNGETVLDFGQNLAGVVRMRVQGPRGTTVRLQHGEALDAQGNFTIGHLMMTAPKEGKELPPFQEVQYTLKGEGVELYEPRFTVHGFRYVQVMGYPGTPAPENFEAVAIYSDMPPTGTFTCSDPLLNQLHKNVEWSMKGNFLDIPTDCPQRERAGWTGDIQIFTPSASFLMDTRAFLRKWLEDLKLEQFPNGMVGNFVPNPMKLAQERGLATIMRRLDGSSGWGDVATFMPWELYWAYGDVAVPARQYESMKAWVEYVRGEAARSNWAKRFDGRASDPAWRARQPYIWDRGYHWGEWLEPGDGAPQQMVQGMLQRVLFGSPLVATAYFARSAQIVGQVAALLGRPEEAQEYRALAEQIKAAYAAEFIGPDGRIEPDRQASYVRVLAFDLAPAELKPRIVEHLVRLVRAAGNHVGTGFLSTVYLCQVLADNGRLDVAYDLLMQTTIPSWLYAVTRGATTIWETWEGIDEAGNPHASLNHYSPGAVVNFLHRTVAGIRADAPGYRRIVIHPQPGGGLAAAGAAYASVHGLIASRWAKENGRMRLDVKVPPNTTAQVCLPGARLEQVQEGGVALTAAEDVTGARQAGEDVVVEVGSGEYRFEYPL